jgi:hypothetical protein
MDVVFASRLRIAIGCLALSLAVAGCTRGGAGDDAEPPLPVVEAPAPPPEPAVPATPRPLPPDASVLSPEDRDFLVARGLVNPEAELLADLRAHPELIPCKGDAGGTPGFHDPERIRIVSRDRAEAGFDDGHRDGRLDLGFTVARGKIAWKVEDADCGT